MLDTVVALLAFPNIQMVVLSKTSPKWLIYIHFSLFVNNEIVISLNGGNII